MCFWNNLQELLAIQQSDGPKNLGFFGTRNMGMTHQKLVEILSYAMVTTVRRQQQRQPTSSGWQQPQQAGSIDGSKPGSNSTWRSQPHQQQHRAVHRRSSVLQHTKLVVMAI